MVCPDLKITRESKTTSVYSEQSYSSTKQEEFADCYAFLCPCYSERDKKQYCSKYRPEPAEQ